MILLYAKCHTSPMVWAHPCVLRSRCISRSALSVYRRLHGPILYTFSFSFPGTVPDWTIYTICCFNFEMTVPESSLLWDCKLSCGWCPQPLPSGVPLSWCQNSERKRDWRTAKGANLRGSDLKVTPDARTYRVFFFSLCRKPTDSVQPGRNQTAI